MSAPTKPRNGRIRKVTTLLPLALLSAAFTANIAGANAPSVVSAGAADSALPDGSAVPAKAIEAPASVSNGDGLGLGLGDGDTTRIVATASTSGIPSAALSAYQRAETVINAADKTCNLSWQLIAAIGRVESNHGRANGNVLDNTGLAKPGIYGIALNGSNNTTEILDTDAGQFDNDPAYDRAVGPMQFIPSTWSVVGVDADGDGVRNPQDIDDAALGTAVYLCSGDDDLSTLEGQRGAVYRYNHSQSYVDLVLSIMNAYMAGDFTTVPNSVVAAGYLAPTTTPNVIGNPGQVQELETPDEGPSNSPSSPPSSPSTPPSGGGSGGGGGGTGSTGGVKVPQVTVPALPSTSVAPVDEALSEVQAIAQCVADGLNQLLNPDAFLKCVKNYMNP
ncbi:lytic transglycosylase domain-containing protein [Nocardioides sp.]|uniref:lytic transglycosylase domain-containing protein n=1 Tax=Nocardioides sp. TaxID=35761 RepID=UPI00356176DB